LGVSEEEKTEKLDQLTGALDDVKTSVDELEDDPPSGVKRKSLGWR
jgi:hypothetical protein